MIVFIFQIRSVVNVSPWRWLWRSWVQPAPSAGPHWSRTRWRAPRQCAGPPPACGASIRQFRRSTHTHSQFGFYFNAGQRIKVSPEVFDGLCHGGCCSATKTILLVCGSCGGQRTCPCLSEDRRSSRCHQEADPKHSPDTQHPDGSKLLERRRNEKSLLYWAKLLPHTHPRMLRTDRVKGQTRHF